MFYEEIWTKQEYCILYFKKTSKTYVLWGNMNKTRPFLHINLLIKYSIQQHIHFNGNIFRNKYCRCNEGSLYWIGPKWGCQVQEQILFISVQYFLSSHINATVLSSW